MNLNFAELLLTFSGQFWQSPSNYSTAYATEIKAEVIEKGNISFLNKIVFACSQTGL